MTDKCFIDTCDNDMVITYNGTPVCIECWELFGYDDAEERDKVTRDE